MIWPIEVKYIAVPSGISGSIMINQKEAVIEIQGINENEYVKFNHNFAWFYICNYTQTDERLGLLRNLDFLNPFDRFGLLQDLKFSKQFEMRYYNFFRNEADIGVWL